MVGVAAGMPPMVMGWTLDRLAPLPQTPVRKATGSETPAADPPSKAMAVPFCPLATT